MTFGFIGENSGFTGLPGSCSCQAGAESKEVRVSATLSEWIPVISKESMHDELSGLNYEMGWMWRF